MVEQIQVVLTTLVAVAVVLFKQVGLEEIRDQAQQV
tara:strand:- start:354 stop:461 length:108 start_codon:yes stop_codon:yes gene_type:complete